MADRAKLIQTLAQSEEDRVLLARVYERICAGYDRNMPTATCFLTEREQELSARLLRGMGLSAFRFFGGRAGAERCVCTYVPDYYDSAEDWLAGEDGPVVAIRASFYAGDRLTHRDFLGSLMGSGIKRETVGDILVGEGQCDLLVLREIAPFVLQSLVSAGRTKLSLAEIPLTELAAPEQKRVRINDTVATLRFDSVVASGFRMARGKAAALIESGRASLNHLPCTKSDRQVAEGDIISLQGFGKARLLEVRGNTKKGRIAIVMERYS